MVDFQNSQGRLSGGLQNRATMVPLAAAGLVQWSRGT